MTSGHSKKMDCLFFGREKELEACNNNLDEALKGRGSTLLLHGGPGIGKTRILKEMERIASEKGVKVLSSTALPNQLVPFELFSSIFTSEMGKPPFKPMENTTFMEVFAINTSGLLVAKASEFMGLDADIFAGMLSAVQMFVKDSFAQAGDGQEGKGGLGRLEYGDKKILIEHGEHLYITAIIQGTENPEMRLALRSSLNHIESEYGVLLSKWNGDMNEVAPVQDEIEKLSGLHFKVRVDPSRLELKKERLALADQCLSILSGWSEPILVLLDNLQWADECSLFTLQYLARNITGEHVLILGASRQGESQAYDNFINSVSSEGTSEVLNIKQLSQGSLVNIIDHLFSPNLFPNEFKSTLAAKSEGNPFFLLETLNHMEQYGTIVHDVENYILSSRDISIPDTIQDLIVQRIRVLNAEALSLLEYASCIGSEMDADTLFSIPHITKPKQPFLSLCQTGILEERGNKVGFSQTIFMDAIYQGISPRWKPILHKSLGEHLEQSSNIEDVLYDLARHFSQTWEHDKAFRYCMSAGETAKAHFAPEQALIFYQWAKKALPKSTIIRDRKVKGLEIDMESGELMDLVGDWSSAKNLYQNDLELAEEINPKAHAELLLSLGSIKRKLGELDEALTALEQGLHIFEELNDLKGIAKVYSNIGLIHWNNGDYEKAIKQHQKELDISRKIGDRWSESRALLNLGMDFWQRRDLEKAIGAYQEKLDIDRGLDNKQGVNKALKGIGLIHWNLGRYEKAMDYFKRSYELSKKIGDKISMGNASCNMGLVHADMENLNDAMARYEEYLRICMMVGDKAGLNIAYGNIADIHFINGDIARSNDYYQKKLDIAEQLNNKRGMCYAIGHIGRNELELGNIEKAEDQINKAWMLAEELDDKYFLSEVREFYGKLYHEKGLLSEAEEQLELSIDAGKDVVNPSYLGDKLLLLAILQLEMGKNSDACENLHRAKDFYNSVHNKKGLGAVIDLLKHVDTS